MAKKTTPAKTAPKKTAPAKAAPKKSAPKKAAPRKRKPYTVYGPDRAKAATGKKNVRRITDRSHLVHSSKLSKHLDPNCVPEEGTVPKHPDER